METQIFVNLPVKNLESSIAFFTKLGFGFNARFTNEKATCMIISESSFVMLLVEPFFKSFTTKEISDATKSTEVIICLSAESKEQVIHMIGLAIDAGGLIYAEPVDQGFMFQHSFADLDGHQWEIMWMDASAFPQPA